ncbi:MAG: diguanylate cyclase [Rhodopseudomonas sp.]|nr:diguanylate cyclase [Rhodopseudomonas sp.]
MWRLGTTEPHITETTERPVRRLLVPMFAVVLGFCAVCSYVLYKAHEAAWQHAADVANSLTSALSSEIERNIETVDLSLQAVADNIDRPDINDLSPDLRQLLLFDRSATAHNLGKIVVVDETGHIRYDSKSLKPAAANLSDRDYFIAQKPDTATGLFISQPAISRLSGMRFIGLSRRLSNVDGSFAGVAVASLRQAYFERLFRHVVLGPSGTITLLRSDGVILSRWPLQRQKPDLNLRRSVLLERLKTEPQGHFTITSSVDDVRRLVSFRQVGDFPLVISVGQSAHDIYAEWRKFALSVGAMILTLCLLTILLAIHLVRELGRRKDAESKLAVLAATDSLTGLANRRSFKDAIGREWQRSQREQTTLAMMMIDVDKFKTYNDVHGHQAGDRLLRAVGHAIAGGIGRGGDIGARYGGDEFAVLLPGTDIAGALRVADNIRQAFAAQIEEKNIAAGALSIGVASITPHSEEIFGELIQLADIALYRAKHLGRSRTETASRESDALKHETGAPTTRSASRGRADKRDSGQNAAA